MQRESRVVASTSGAAAASAMRGSVARRGSCAGCTGVARIGEASTGRRSATGEKAAAAATTASITRERIDIRARGRRSQGANETHLDTRNENDPLVLPRFVPTPAAPHQIGNARMMISTAPISEVRDKKSNGRNISTCTHSTREESGLRGDQFDMFLSQSADSLPVRC